MSSETHIKQGSNQGSSQTGKRILTFDDVLRESDYVLCDTSVSRSHDNWYTKTFLRLHEKPKFSLGEIGKEIVFARRFAEFLENPKVFVTSSVSEEILEFVDSLKRSMGLVKIKAGFNRGWLRRNDFDILDGFYDLMETCYYKCKESELFPPQKTEYDFLERIVLSVTEETGAKIASCKVGRVRKSEDLHTDEQLVSSALYLAASENKSCSIITGDSDIKRILFYTLSYLTYPHTFAYAGIVESTVINQIRVYHPFERGKFYQRYNSSEFSSDSRLEIPKEKVIAIRQRINSLQTIH